MDAEALKNQVNQFIEEDNLDDAFTILKENISQSSDLYDELLMLLNRNARLMKQGRKGTLSYVDLDLLNNNLINDVSSFLKELDDSHLTIIPNKFPTKKIEDKILVFAPDENYKLDLEEYFKRLNFTNIHINLYENDIDPSDFVLIVFDNRDLPFSRGLDEQQEKMIRARTDFMEKCLRVNPFGLHFGHFLSWVSSNREYVNAANSSFTLFARIKEMLEFLDALK